MDLPEDAFVADVEALLARLLQPDARAGMLGEAARGLCLAPGAKRVRPRLVAIAGRLLNVPAARLAAPAVAGELVHAASLLHDDVVDEAALRRGRATANSRFGNHAAVLAGDWLLATSLSWLAQEEPSLVPGALKVVAEMSVAAAREVEARGRPREDLATWRAVAEGKTGALFGWCGAAVALLREQGAPAVRLDGFGRHAGVAFQLADDLRDLLDVHGNKAPYADLRNGNLSHPLLVACAKEPALAGKLRAVPADQSSRYIEQVAAEVLATGAARESAAALEAEIEAALGALGPLRGEEAGRELEAWTRTACAIPPV